MSQILLSCVVRVKLNYEPFPQFLVSSCQFRIFALFLVVINPVFFLIQTKSTLPTPMKTTLRLIQMIYSLRPEKNFYFNPAGSLAPQAFCKPHSGVHHKQFSWDQSSHFFTSIFPKNFQLFSKTNLEKKFFLIKSSLVTMIMATRPLHTCNSSQT